MEAAVETPVATAITARQAKVLQVKPESQKTACILSEAAECCYRISSPATFAQVMKLTSLWGLIPPAPERRSTSAGPRLRHAPTTSTTHPSATPTNPGP